MKSLLKGHHRRSSSVDQDFAAEKRIPLKINTALSEAPNSSPLHQTSTFSSTSPPGTTPVTPTSVHPSTFFGSPSAGAKRAFKPIKNLLRNKNSNSSLVPDKKSLSPTKELFRPVVKTSVSTPSIYGTKTHTWGEDPFHSSESRPALESLTSLSTTHSMNNRDEFSFHNESRCSVHCEKVLKNEKNGDTKSEKLDQDDDTSSVFSFEQNAKSGRNASIRYYKDKNELLCEEDKVPVNPGKFRKGAKQSGFIDDFLASTGEFDEQDFQEEMNYYDEDDDDETDDLFNRQLFSSDDEEGEPRDVESEEIESEEIETGENESGENESKIRIIEPESRSEESSPDARSSQPADTGSEIHNLLLTASCYDKSSCFDKRHSRDNNNANKNNRYSWFPKDEEKLRSAEDPLKKSPMSSSSKTNKSTSDDSDNVSCNYSLPAVTSKYQNFFNESEELDELDDSVLDEINQVPADFEFGRLHGSDLKKSNSINDSKTGLGIARSDSSTKFQKKHKTITLFTASSQQNNLQEDDFDFATLKLSTRFQKFSKQPNSPLTTISETSFDSPGRVS